MSVTVSAYTVVRDDYTSLDLPLSGKSTLEPGGEAVIPPGDDITNGNGDYLFTVPGVFAAWIDTPDASIDSDQAVIHDGGKRFCAGWLRAFRSGKPYRMVRVEFQWPDDGGVEADPAHPHGPYATKWAVKRADVIEELTLEDIEAIVAA